MQRDLLDTARITFVLVFVMVFAIASYGEPLEVAVPDGYATQNGGTTGGGSATPITVTTASEFISAVDNDNPAVIIVQGRLNVGNVDIGSNKTIIGADTSSGLYGGRVRVKGSNYIFQNLTIGPSGSDSMEVSGATNVFIHKCEFYDSSDELCSIVRQADYVTISWCKFYFLNPDSHSYAHLIGNGDDVIADRGKLNTTMHHNWYAEGIRGRMPRVRFGHVHIYNNYYNSVGNGYCIGIGVECHIRLENTHFDNVNAPWADYGGTSNGEIGWSNLIFEGCSEPTFMPNAYPVFTPPYSFTMDPVEDVESLVTDPDYGAGNRLSGLTMSPYGDFTGDHIVDMNDMPDFLSYWLIDECNQTEGVDLNDDCLVNFYEFSVLANNMKLKPEIALSTTSLEQLAGLGIDAPNQVFEVWNNGAKTLNYTISDDVAWLSVSPDYGTATGLDAKNLHTVYYDTDSLALGMHYATITISDSNASNSPQTIAVTLEVMQPEISLSTTSLEQVAGLGSDAPNQAFEVWNSSVETLNYTISDDVAWLSVSEGSGSSTGSDDKQLHTVVYDTDSLALGTYYATITISDPAASNDPQTISVTLNVSEQGSFVAYNDLNSMNSSNAANVTVYDYTASNVKLKNFSTGDDLFFSMTCSYVGGYEPYGNGGNFDPGTDAYLAFNDIVDATGVYEIDNISDSYTITFNNLQPGREYTITLTANLDDSGYEEERYTKVTIEGAQTYTNASSIGVEVNSEASVSFCTGYNTENGYVAKWTGVTTGPDGSFSVKSEWDDYLDGTRAYAMTVFKLESQSP